MQTVSTIGLYLGRISHHCDEAYTGQSYRAAGFRAQTHVLGRLTIWRDMGSTSKCGRKWPDHPLDRRLDSLRCW
jgi:hypothetical protein